MFGGITVGYMALSPSPETDAEDEDTTELVTPNSFSTESPNAVTVKPPNFLEMKDGNIRGKAFLLIDPETGREVHGKIVVDERGICFIVNGHRLSSSEMLPKDPRMEKFGVESDPKKLFKSVRKQKTDFVVHLNAQNAVLTIPHDVVLRADRAIMALADRPSTVEIVVDYRLDFPFVIDVALSVAVSHEELPRRGPRKLAFTVEYPPGPAVPVNIQ